MFEGYWLDNKMHGYGRIIYSDSSSYTGDFRNGKRNGYGIYFHADIKTDYGGLMNFGDRFEGNWKDDLIYGPGTLYYKNGEVTHGIFNCDFSTGIC